MTYHCAVHCWFTRAISVSHSTCLLSPSVTVVLCTHSSKCLTIHIYLSYTQFLHQYLDIYIWFINNHTFRNLARFRSIFIRSEFCKSLPSLFETTATTSTSKSGLFTPFSSAFTAGYASHFYFYHMVPPWSSTSFAPVPLHSGVGVSHRRRPFSFPVALPPFYIFYLHLFQLHPPSSSFRYPYLKVLPVLYFVLPVHLPSSSSYLVLPFHLPSSFFLLHNSLPFPCLLITIPAKPSSAMWIAQ